MKVELISNVSHDLKTPLTSVLSYAELLRQEPLEGAAADYARIIDEKAHRLAVMVQDVFEVSKAASGQLPVQPERLDFAKKMGVEYTINSKEVNAVEKVLEITGEGAQLVMECSGANVLIRQSLDMVCHAGRITFTGWPKQETSLPTDMITRKEIDIRGARTSAGEFEEALELLHSGKVKLMDTVTKIISMEEAPATIIDNEKNPGDYIKVIVKVAD